MTMPLQTQGPAGGSQRVVPVIMSGGSGTRLWPLSTAENPKQFHAFASDESLIQETALRVSGPAPMELLPPIVICNAAHQALVERHLAEVGISPAAVVLEPFGRNTAAVAAIAAALAAELFPGALALLLPADHVVTDPQGFLAVVAKASPTARDNIVTFGIEPTRPETGYGYIKQGAPLIEGVFQVERFTEKPPLALAESYLAEGGYAWNAGIFLFAPEVMLEEMEKSRPDVKAAALAALAASPRAGVVIALAQAEFAACPSVPVDVAVMEQTPRAAVAPCQIGWADIGSWSELWRLGPQDAAGNRTRGRVVAVEVKDSLLWSDGPAVAALGVEDLIVVATAEAVIVLPKHRSQEVKALLEQMSRTR